MSFHLFLFLHLQDTLAITTTKQTKNEKEISCEIGFQFLTWLLEQPKQNKNCNACVDFVVVEVHKSEVSNSSV